MSLSGDGYYYTTTATIFDSWQQSNDCSGGMTTYHSPYSGTDSLWCEGYQHCSGGDVIRCSWKGLCRINHNLFSYFIFCYPSSNRTPVLFVCFLATCIIFDVAHVDKGEIKFMEDLRFFNNLSSTTHRWAQLVWQQRVAEWWSRHRLFAPVDQTQSHRHGRDRRAGDPRGQYLQRHHFDRRTSVYWDLGYRVDL